MTLPVTGGFLWKRASNAEKFPYDIVMSDHADPAAA